ncbi:MAG: type II secretion system protein [bacterium]
MKRNRRAFGFTLVEIMIVVTIIGILASLAVPAFQRARWKAVETSIRNNLRQMWGAAQQYMLENGVSSVQVSSIVAWKPKGCDTHGTNDGYTSIIQQVASEDYDTFKAAYDCKTVDPNTTTTDTPNGTEGYLYENTNGIEIKVDCTRYVKLVL